MTKEMPIGRREGLRLEFKQGDSLAHPESIVREVVGLLNAEGGEVWIGVREDRGVAVETEGLDDPEGARQRLRDTVLDLVEPMPTDAEVALTVHGDPKQALRITVTPSAGRRPYILRRGGRLELPIRFADRLRPMTRREIEDAFAGARASGGVGGGTSAEERALLADQEEILKSDAPNFWLGIEPLDATPYLKLERLLTSGILEDPSLSDNRWYGITFQLAAQALLERGGPEVELHQGRKWLRVGRETPFDLWIGETGALRSRVALVEHPFSYPPDERSPIPELRQGRSLEPKALLEFPVSLFRLLSTLHRSPEFRRSPPTTTRWDSAVALANVEGWVIEPGPTHPARRYPSAPYAMPLALRRRPQPYSDGQSFVGRVAHFTDQQFLEYPDGCAFRLMSQVFAAFGWLEEEIPYFNRAKIRLEIAS